MSSRFLNVSPRVYIRQKDSVNILPRIPRTGYQNELGIEESKFDDVDTVIFADGGVVLAPYMISSSLAQDSGFYTGSLLLTASITDRASYFDKNVENDPIFPFKERFKTISETSFDVGFPQDQYPGFSSPPSDKVAIVIDMSQISDFQLTKLQLDDSLRDLTGPLYNQRASGFAYYNQTNKSWNDIGIEDRASSAVVDYDPILTLLPISVQAGNHEIGGKDQLYMSQFTSSPYSIVTEKFYIPSTNDSLKARGYHKIGEPTSFFGAPHSPRYHAKENQTIKLSNYITAPFVVDRIEVKFPVKAYRSQTPGAGGPAYASGYGRDIDNYVFFVYVQNRINSIVDSKNDVSSSIRYLIGKESFCFSNQPTLDEVYSGLKPLHDVTQSFFFNMASSATQFNTYVTDINLNFRPKTFNQEFGTPSKLAGRGKFAATIETGSLFVKNFWNGGQYASGNLGNPFLVTDTTNFNARRGIFTEIPSLANPSPRALVTSFWEGTKQTILTGSSFRTTTTSISTVSLIDSSKETPVILFPDDELIFGIESGANPVMKNPVATRSSNGGYEIDVLAVTGSRLQISAGAAYVILYGSMIREGVEQLPSLNQYLGSDAVHEDIHEPGPYDQFDISTPMALSASYVDNFITGSLLRDTSRRIFLRSSTTVPLSGTLQRNVRFVDGQSLYYDTLIPPITVISGGLDLSSLSGSGGIINPNVLRITKDNTAGYPFDNTRGQNLLKRSFTYENFDGSARIKTLDLHLFQDVGGGLYAPDVYLTGDNAKFALYYNGRFNSYASTVKNYEGAASLRYGLLSPRLVGPSYVFRRDHYGHFRDLIEQSKDSKMITTIDGKDTVNRSIVVATFVSASSDTVVSAEETQCSNLSYECTSSVPFIDDNAPHNRGSLPAHIVSFGPNNLIFGITGSFGYQ